MSTMADTKRRRTRRSFTEEYKTGAVDLVLNDGKTVAKLAGTIPGTMTATAPVDAVARSA